MYIYIVIMTFRSAKTMDTQSNRLNACISLQTTKTVNPLTCIFKRYSIIFFNQSEAATGGDYF